MIKNSVFQNIKQKHNTGKTIGYFTETIGCFTETIGCFTETIGCFTETIGCFTETIGCLYQLLIDKTEFKEIGIEKLYTFVYTGSLQIQTYI